MLALKYSHQLSWGDLKFIEDPMHAIRTVESEHGRRNGGKSIENAHLHDLPNGDDRRFDPYRFLKTKLERGDVFLVNRSTLAPAVTSLDIDDDGNPEYTLRHSTSQYFHSAFRSALRHIPESKPVGVFRDEPKQEIETKKPEKIINTKEKHQIKIKYVTVNGAENPDTYEVKLTVLNASTNRIYMRQAIDVLKHDTSKVFSIEKGEKFKIYPVREHMIDVREDFAQNKNFAQSEANKRIKPLDIEPSEEIQDGVTLHTVTIHVPPILRMGCFFDGTGNDTSDPVKLSNVHKLYTDYDRKIKKLPESFKVAYVRGVGTEGDGWSEVLGSMGGFGAVDRIAGMIYKLEDACKNYKDIFEGYPEMIHLDVFGFSRGATTARHFINVMKQGFYGFNDQNHQTYITPNNIMISFAGLFDSVGSYGMAGDENDPGYNFNINPRWITEKGKVIHLIALNEYRDNFDLQTIFSHQNRYYTENIYTEKRSEIGMMGAHSDVGGGYAPNEQGVVNGQNNPSQMAVMSLQKMHELALQNGVPLDPLKAMSIEPALTDNYRIVNDAIQHPKARRLWMEWVEYLKYKEILEYRLNEMETQARPMAGRPASVMALQQTRRKIETANKSIADLERRLAPEILNVDFEVFKEAFMHLDEHYIHESHGPFNKTPGMWAQKEGSLFTVDRIKRTVFFNEAKEFKKENTEWDRIARIAPAWMILAEIQDFDIIKAKEFK
jgi:hypothetical protein